jgi:IS605 OrfB family transposase
LTAENLPVPGGRLVKVENRLPHAKKAVRLWDRLPAEHAALLEREKELDKNKGREREALLDKIAEVLDAKACRDVSADFKKTWEKEDKLWPQRLRELSAWLVRGRERQNDGKWIRVRGKAAWAKVGGLSLERISTLEQFARLHRAYAHRPTLERLRDDSQETVPHGRAIRDKLELLREDRLKKLANAVAMAAMGLVATQQDKAREVEKGRHAGSRFAPVHAVVIEDLEFYRPEVSRTRRENRGLMSWSARELAKRLGDACELHGLLFLQVRPNYTSRFCSRCGAPGVRGQWIRPSQIARDWYWSRQAAKAQEAKEVERTDLQRLLLKPDGSGKPEIFLPRQGGASFRCSNKDCGVGGGIQADLNAAANIGLRALLDGRWNRAWSYLPTKAGKPTGEGALRGMPESLCGEVLDADAAKDAKQVVNLFRDPSRAASPKESSWKSYKEFFREVESGILSVK